MKYLNFVIVLCVAALLGNGIVYAAKHIEGTGALLYASEDLIHPPFDRFSWIAEWERPPGPLRVGLQAGHYKNDELPDELIRLKNSTGSSGGGKLEWEVNLVIALATKSILESHGVVVDILPATVPPRYWADVFVSIHADGSSESTSSGFKVAGPWRDYSGQSGELVSSIEKRYAQHTRLPVDPNITRNMRGYYAFAWWRYEHSVHPRTASAILEAGFLTSPQDRETLIGQPELAARGLAEGILDHLDII